MKFTLGQIPDSSLRHLGITKSQLEGIPAKVLERLLSGIRSQLIRFRSVPVPGTGMLRSLDARISLFRKTDGSLGLRIHPIREGPVNLYGLDHREEKLLQRDPDARIEKKIAGKDGRELNVEVGYDPVTRSYSANGGTSERPSDPRVKEVRNGEGNTSDEKASQGGMNSKEGASNLESRNPSLRRLSFSHSRVEDVDLVVDMAILASGAGGLILLEHLADMALHTRIVKKPLDLRDPAVRDMLASSVERGAGKDLRGDLGRIGRELGERLRMTRDDGSSRNGGSAITDHGEKQPGQRKTGPMR